MYVMPINSVADTLVIQVHIYQLFSTHISFILTIFHSERPKLYTILAFLSAIGLLTEPL